MEPRAVPPSMAAPLPRGMCLMEDAVQAGALLPAAHTPGRQWRGQGAVGSPASCLPRELAGPVVRGAWERSEWLAPARSVLRQFPAHVMWVLQPPQLPRVGERKEPRVNRAPQRLQQAPAMPRRERQQGPGRCPTRNTPRTKPFSIGMNAKRQHRLPLQ